MLKAGLPIAVLAIGIIGAWGIFDSRPRIKRQTVAEDAPVVEIVRAVPETVRLNVHSQGVVSPRTEIELTAEVAGKVVHVHPSFAAGGFFSAGDLLVTIDPRDDDYAVVIAEGRVAEARSRLAQEQARVKQARYEWQTLRKSRPAPIALREPQLAEARAKLKATEAELAAAKLNRERCELRAPFAGRVREKYVDAGEYVAAGKALAGIYSIDVGEIRLPIVLDQAGFLNLPLTRSETSEKPVGPQVTLTARFAGQAHRWRGQVVRTEATVDETTGTIFAVAQVKDPYGPGNGGPPLLAGLFVQADIQGREHNNVFVLPLSAVTMDHQAFIVDESQHLVRRRLSVLRREAERVIVDGGLAVGESVVVSAPAMLVDGMRVRIKPEKGEPDSGG